MARTLPALLVILLSAACSPPSEDLGSVGTPPESPRQVFRDENGTVLGVQVAKTLYLSAVGPADPQAPIAAQTRSAMESMGGTLGEAGLDYSNVVSCHVHLSDMDNYADMNSVYGGFYEEGQYPARTTLELPGLPQDAGVLLMCIAYTDSTEISVIKPPADQIPPAMGPYSSAVRAGRTVYLSGQGGRNPQTGELPPVPSDQAEQTLRTIRTILAAADLTFDNVLLASSYVPPSTAQADIESVLADSFSPGGAPSGARVGLSRLPGGIAVEITFIAADDNYITRLFMHDEPPDSVSSPASLSSGVIYTSAMAGDGSTFEEQFESALAKHTTALDHALMDLTQVARVVAYVADMDDLQELQSLVSSAFPGSEPALVAVEVRHPEGTDVALEMIAVK